MAEELAPAPNPILSQMKQQREVDFQAQSLTPLWKPQNYIFAWHLPKK
jgi:hypothetical protein